MNKEAIQSLDKKILKLTRDREALKKLKSLNWITIDADRADFTTGGCLIFAQALEHLFNKHKISYQRIVALDAGFLEHVALEAEGLVWDAMGIRDSSDFESDLAEAGFTDPTIVTWGKVSIDKLKASGIQSNREITSSLIEAMRSWPEWDSLKG